MSPSPAADLTPSALAALKERVDAYGRKALAKRLNMTYSQLDRRLNEFTPFREIEIAAINRVLGKADMRRKSATLKLR